MKNPITASMPFGANAWSILGTFSKEATKAGWSKEQIKEVLDEAQTGNYDHLQDTIEDACKGEE